MTKAPSQPFGSTPRRLAIIVGVSVLAAAGVGLGLAVAAGAGSSSSGMMGSSSATMGSGSFDGSMSSYYQSMMKSYGGSSSMMGGSTGKSSYGWMMGGTEAPGWMTGGKLSASMMGTSTNAGKVMGRLFANAPGPRVRATQATRLGDDVPTGAIVDGTHNHITLSGFSDHLVVLASPSSGPDETFRIAGLVDPTIEVKSGAKVGIEMVNADAGAAHGLVVTAKGSASSRMPMMTATPAFSGSALWFLGNRTSAGMHTGTLTFTAAKSGTYQYLCPVPGHARDGMVGAFVVAG
jgi:rusticyanin